MVQGRVGSAHRRRLWEARGCRIMIRLMSMSRFRWLRLVVTRGRKGEEEIGVFPFHFALKRGRRGSDLADRTSLTRSCLFRRRISELAASIKSTFEPVIMTQLYPHSQIDIYVQVLQQDGGSHLRPRPSIFLISHVHVPVP